MSDVDKKLGKMLRLYDKEELACTNCGELTSGDNIVVRYVWVVDKVSPKVKEKDEVDVWCVNCWEREEE